MNRKLGSVGTRPPRDPQMPTTRGPPVMSMRPAAPRSHAYPLSHCHCCSHQAVSPQGWRWAVPGLLWWGVGHSWAPNPRRPSCLSQHTGPLSLTVTWPGQTGETHPLCSVPCFWVLLSGTACLPDLCHVLTRYTCFRSQNSSCGRAMRP